MSMLAAQPASPRRPRACSERGFTLVELMVSLSGGLFLSVVVFALARDTSRFYQREARLASATLAGITGFERLKADIERASYLCTPNLRTDLLVRPLAPANQALLDLAGIRIEAKGSAVSNAAFTANATAGQTIEPDSIILAGSYSATDEFPGSISSDGSTITLAPNSPSLARLGFLTTPDDNIKEQLIQGVFAVGRIVRFMELGSRFQSYGLISEAKVEGGLFPTITLTAPLNGVGGFAQGSSVNVVNRIRYSIGSIGTTDWDSETWKPLKDATEGAPGETERTELLRQEIDPIDPTGTPLSTDIAAEYGVDLAFGVTGQANKGGPLTYASSTDDAFQQFFVEGGGRPEGVRSVRVRLSVRSREADRESNVANMNGLYRFKLGADLGWARVRTFQADVPLPNQAGVTW